MHAVKKWLRETEGAGRFCAVLVAVILAGCRAPGPDGTGDPGLPRPREAEGVPIDTVLERIDLDAHGLPDLPLKRHQKYAYSSSDVTPFGYVEPYREHFLEQMEYTGPGRAATQPDDVTTVRIGFLGPIAPTVSVATGGKSHEEVLGNAMLKGARLAVEQANADGGYGERGIPFELVVHNDNGLWGASGNEVIDMAYKEKVWAILGTIDGANTHIGIRVALKAEIVVMTPGDTDPTYVETNIPWAMRCIGDDRQQNYMLLDYLYRKLGYHRVAIMRASNRYGRFGIREFRDGSRRLGRPVVMEMAYKVGAGDYSLQLERIAEAKPEAVLHWGDARDGAWILNQMRDRGMAQPYFSCDRCVSDEFVELAGENAEGVVCSYPWDPTRTDPKLEAFRAAFRERFGEEPETYASHGYDGMNLLIWAIRTAGLNRAKIRDVLAYRTDPWPGVTGDIPFSAALDDAGEVFLARLEGGEWRFYSRADLRVPSGLEGQAAADGEAPPRVSQATPER